MSCTSCDQFGFRSVSFILVGLCISLTSTILAMPAYADDPGVEALGDFREGSKPKNAVENRFFLKKNRFEIAPVFGYVPNNAFARRFVGGIVLNYHFTETLAAASIISYSPDLGEDDLKGLTSVLLDRAYNQSAGASGNSFQQPLDKVTLSALFGILWSPFYGKINLMGEQVVNFDLYLFGGLGMLSKVNYVAKYDDQSPDPNDIVMLVKGNNEYMVSPVLGVGMNFFITQTVALKIDARSALYVDKKPQYDANIPVDESRVYNNFTAAIGVGLFFPKMKPRLLDF